MSAGGLIETAIAIPLQIMVLLNGWKYFQFLPNRNTLSDVCMYAFVAAILLWSIYWDWKVLSHTGRYYISRYKDKLDWRECIVLPLFFLTKAWLGPIIGLICCLLPNKFRFQGIIDSIEKWWIFGGYLLFCILSAFFGMFPHGRNGFSPEDQRFHEIEKSVTGWRRDIEPVKFISLL